MTGTLERIWVKRAHRGPMDPVDRVAVNPTDGIVGDANRGRRQVTIIEREEWDRLMQETGGQADPSARRANLMVSGLPLRDSLHRVLRFGAVRIRILGETKPCERMEEAVPGLKDAMFDNWAGGAFGEVIAGGTVSRGAPVEWETAP